jgi:hypothetical protein
MGGLVNAIGIFMKPAGVGSGPPPSGSYIIKETGEYLVMESSTSDYMIIE